MSKQKKEVVDEELADFEETETIKPTSAAAIDKKPAATKGYSSVNSSGFRDFLLKPEILRAIADCGFEHPSEVQHECIPQAMTGNDVLCQAKSGMGKTAVFVISVLQQLQVEEQKTMCVILCHARELAFQICQEFSRFTKYLPEVKVKSFIGGLPIKNHIDQLKQETPHIVVGTPGRVLQLAKGGHLKLGNVKFFIVDECDKVLESTEMRDDMQEVCINCLDQVMLF